MSIPLIPRFLERRLGIDLDDGGKIILLYGPRQAGTTTLVKKLIADRPSMKTLFLTGDDSSDRGELEGRDGTALLRLTEGYDCLVVDEAQRVAGIGLGLKLLHDSCPRLRIMATGSSSFELASRTAEPLTGRSRTFILYPIAMLELAELHDRLELHRNLSDYLVFGSYPEVRLALGREDKRRALKAITEAYLYKDVIQFGGIKHSDRIHDLLRLLAFQVGSEVSIAELASSLGLSRDTVDRYIDILEKAYVVFRQKGYARNLRKEVTKMDRIFFYDVGVRNMVIGNLAEPELRDDTGRLWGNFLVSERRKTLDYHESWARTWFWRLRTGAEVDYVEEEDGRLRGYEFKYGSKTPRAPASWEATYPGSSFTAVNNSSWLEFVLGSDGNLQ